MNLSLSDIDPLIDKILNSGRYKVVNSTVFDYSWDVIDLDDNKRKLLFKIKANKHLKLIKLLANINNSNIWKWNFFEDDDKCYAIEEQDYYQLKNSLWVEIEKYKTKKTKIEEAQIIIWLKQILNAINCLHENKILHHKLDTFIRLVNSEIIINVDWDCDIIENIEDKLENLTKSDITYNCPEICDTGTIDLKYDIWCVGFILYNLCTLKDPSKDLDEINDFKQWTQPTLPNDISEELNYIFRRMTRIEKQLRPTALELLKEPIFTQKYDVDLNIGSILIRKYKIVEENKQSYRSWHVLDIDDNKRKKLILLDDHVKFKLDLSNMKLDSKNLIRTHHFIHNLNLYFVKPNFEISLYNILDDLKQKNELIKEDQILSWLDSIISALIYLHKNFIIHKWINPREVGIYNNSIKLCLTSESIKLQTKFDCIKVDENNIFYNCPELFSTGYINFKYDMWSLGWVLYHMCTLDNMIIVYLEKIKNFLDSNISLNLPDSTSAELKFIFKRLTDINPDLRPDAEDLIIENLLKNTSQF